MTRPEGWLHRAPRPLMLWLAIVTTIMLVVFFVSIGFAIVAVYQRAAAEFRPVPDMSGGIAAIIGSVAVLLPAIVQFMQVFHGRHRERMDQQARGTASSAPFAPSPPSSPPEGGPRPQEQIPP